MPKLKYPPQNSYKLLKQKTTVSYGGWGGVAKIAHNSIIGDYQEGGIKYKDLQTFVLSVNYKFLYRLNNHSNSNSTCLPRFWLMQLFKIPTEYDEDDDQKYFHDLFSNQLNILDCKFKVPRKAT